jgi:hypothetical protein
MGAAPQGGPRPALPARRCASTSAPRSCSRCAAWRPPSTWSGPTQWRAACTRWAPRVSAASCARCAAAELGAGNPACGSQRVCLRGGTRMRHMGSMCAGNAVYDTFKLFDSDNSGSLSGEEIRDAFFSLGVFLSDGVVSQIMDVSCGLRQPCTEAVWPQLLQLCNSTLALRITCVNRRGWHSRGCSFVCRCLTRTGAAWSNTTSSKRPCSRRKGGPERPVSGSWAPPPGHDLTTSIGWARLGSQ